MNKTDTNITLKDLPLEQRPRERLASVGVENLSDTELLAILLNTGFKGQSVTHSAAMLIKEFGSLENLTDASIYELMKIKGIGKAKACKLVAAFHLGKKVHNRLLLQESNKIRYRKSVTNASAAADIVRNKISDFNVEHYIILCFDIKNRLILSKEITMGILTASIVHPRETFETAIKTRSASIIIAHNHPSGDPMPSENDMKVTQRIKEAGKIIGIELIDHIVVTKDSYYSFAENGKIY